jgi:hypothetical protein
VWEISFVQNYDVIVRSVGSITASEIHNVVLFITHAFTMGSSVAFLT